MSAFYFFETEKIEKRAFLFLPKIWKHFVPGVDFQLNEYLHRNGRNHTLCSSIQCLPGHIALLWISTIWEKVSEKTETHCGAANCWASPGKCVLLHLCQVRIWRWDVCVPGASNFVPNQDCTARRPLANFPLLKRYSFPCSRITLWKNLTS